MNFDGLKRAIQERFNIESLKSHGDKGVGFVVNNSLHLFLEQDAHTDETVLYSSLGILPKDRREQVMELLLKANLFGHLTHGAVFAVDPSKGAIVLSQRIPRDLHGDQEFFNILERFVGVHKHWEERIKESKGQ